MITLLKFQVDTNSYQRILLRFGHYRQALPDKSYRRHSELLPNLHHTTSNFH